MEPRTKGVVSGDESVNGEEDDSDRDEEDDFKEEEDNDDDDQNVVTDLGYMVHKTLQSHRHLR
ncbi:MAG: hypothetical protein M1830_004406 [Pleopsidium flavum]|nr:MAG: hypothetical protein M1830_004406 [Pleopsidium flavum]